MNDLMQLSDRLALSPTVPADLRQDPKNRPYTPKVIAANVLAVILYGQELGFGPMSSLNLINLVKGKTTLSAQGMNALVTKRGGRISVVDSTLSECTVKGTRDGETMTVKWTMEDAKRAGLANGHNWKKYPKEMLYARAVSTLCRRQWPDILLGLYTPDEIMGIDAPPPSTQQLDPPEESPQLESPATPWPTDTAAPAVPQGNNMTNAHRDRLRLVLLRRGESVGLDEKGTFQYLASRYEGSDGKLENLTDEQVADVNKQLTEDEARWARSGRYQHKRVPLADVPEPKRAKPAPKTPELPAAEPADEPADEPAEADL